MQTFYAHSLYVYKLLVLQANLIRLLRIKIIHIYNVYLLYIGWNTRLFNTKY